MLGTIVKVTVDRPIGTIHNGTLYPINYGYIENTLALDNEEIDAYILDAEGAIESYTGKVIAVIHRTNDVEDKLVVANKMFSKKEIFELTYFQEKYFDSYIEMLETSYDDLVWDIKNAGLVEDDVLMIHSSLKSVGKLSSGPESLVNAFTDTLTNGLVIFPTHTWATIREDDMVYNPTASDSCVGALTNIARRMPGFKRSLHPTHSVCAYGNEKEKYLNSDLESNTPVSPKGCFGILKDMNGKILFLGAPLSKNTFVHSIEEEMNVPDRFTEHIYHFTSMEDGIKRDYYMPRHFSTKSPHISDHYEKLLPTMLRLGVAKRVYIGNSISYLVDANKCYCMVKKILQKDLHAFDDFREIDHLV